MKAPQPQPDDDELITRALVDAGRQLGLTLSQLARVVGVSDSAMKNYSRGSANMAAAKSQELGLGLIRVYRALYAILGGNPEQMRHWMCTANRHLRGQVPAVLVQSYQGLAEVNVYLDAMRGRL